MAGDGDHHHRHRHESDREQRDRADVALEVAESGVESRRVEERRQDPDDHDVGRQGDGWDAGRKAEHKPADDEEDRIRDAERVGEQEQRQSRQEQQQELKLFVCAEAAHRGI